MTRAKSSLLPDEYPHDLAQVLKKAIFQNNIDWHSDGFSVIKEPRYSENKLAEMCYLYRRTHIFWDVLDGWRSPEAPRRQQRRGYSDRTSERSRDLVGARVVRDAKKGGEKLRLRQPCIFFRRRGWSTTRC